MIRVKEYSLEGSKARECAQKFNEVFADHAGYAPRSPRLWRDLYRRSLETYLLVAEEDRTLGYTIVTLQRYYGCRVTAVSEFCVWEMQEEALKALLDRIEFYAQKMNAEAIISWDTGDIQFNQAFEEQGFIPLDRSVFSVGPISLSFLKSILESTEGLQARNISHQEINITVDLGRRKIPSYSGLFTIKIDPNGKILVDEGKCSNPYAHIETDVTTFTEIILRICNPYKALISGKIDVTPFWKAIKVINLLKSLSITPKWHIPIGDYF